MEKSITKTMLEEHGRILTLLKKFEAEVEKNNLEKAKQLFSKFDWTLEKHIFVEEKVIFTIYSNTRDEQENQEILYLIKEHKEMDWLISKIQDDLDKNIKPKLTRLGNILMKHADNENNIFYPRLDEELDKEQKTLIIDRANEIIRS